MGHRVIRSRKGKDERGAENEEWKEMNGGEEKHISMNYISMYLKP